MLNLIRNKWRNILSITKNTKYVYKLVWGFSPSRIIITYLSDIIDFGFWIFEAVIFMKYLFGSKKFDRSFREVVLFLLFTLILRFVSKLFLAWVKNQFKPLNNQDVNKSINHMLFKKAGNVELQCYENSDFYNNYKLLTAEFFNKCITLIESGSQFIIALISSLIVIINLFFINGFIGLLSLIPLICNLVLGLKEGVLNYHKLLEYVPHDRRQDYVNRTIYMQDYAKEFRVTNIFSVLKRTYDNAMQEHNKVSIKYAGKLFTLSFVKNLISSPLFFEGIWLSGAFLCLVFKSINVADFVVIANSTITATVMLDELTQGINNLSSNSYYVNKLQEFMNYKEKIPEDQNGIPVPEIIETLEFRHVYFNYSETSEMVLNDINFFLEKGEIVSFVGQNGAGKSTIVKLIMRLYDPVQGNILLNGIDIKEFNLKQYRTLIGATFQDFKIFSFSIADNVTMGNDCDCENYVAASESLKKSGIYNDLIKLPKGLDTTMTKEFDENGLVLSGGMQQKIAIARAFAKKSSILILDEPSSALDPFSENYIFNNLVSFCKNENVGKKISIFISHRMTSSKIADKIYVLSKGQIIESGSHRDLMRMNKVYANLFNKQAENYIINNGEAT